MMNASVLRLLVDNKTPEFVYFSVFSLHSFHRSETPL